VCCVALSCVTCSCTPREGHEAVARVTVLGYFVPHNHHNSRLRQWLWLWRALFRTPADRLLCSRALDGVHQTVAYKLFLS
jgi:hypothetical protein